MDMVINFPKYNEDDGIDVIWNNNARCHITVTQDEVIIEANEEGLMCLGKQLIYLADTSIPKGSHVALDSFFCGENLVSSHTLVLGKKQSNQ